MRAILTLFFLFLTLYGYDLKELIEGAKQNNHTIRAKSLETLASKKQIETQKSGYYPTLDIGAAHINLDKTSAFQPGVTTNLYAKVRIDLFDGFKTSSLIKKQKAIYRSKQNELRYKKRETLLQVTTTYYNLLSTKALLLALYQKSKELQTNIKRLKKFYKAGLAPIESLERLKAEYAANRYNIEALKLKIQQAKEYLSLQTGIRIDKVNRSFFKEPQNQSFKQSEAIEALKEKLKVLKESSNVIDSTYYPNIRVEDSYSFYDYARDSGLKKLHIDEVDRQNRVSIMANMRLFDGGKSKKTKEALKLQMMALQEQIKLLQAKEKIDHSLSLSNLQSAKVNIDSAKSALKAAKSLYRSIKAKFQAGLIDQISYLDALSRLTISKAKYKQALYDYEVAKANYYFKSNKNIEDYIQ
jgi:outer membrane protein TolC